MSTALKITFATSFLFAAGSFVYINYEQQVERANLRQGPVKDAERMRQKMSKKQMANDLEHKEQALLREKYEAVQPLNEQIITAEE